MNEDLLFEIADFILNKANSSELEVVKKAIERRESSGAIFGGNGFNPERMAQNIAKGVDRQVSASKEQVSDLIKNYVTDLIKKEVPDIPQEHLKSLLGSWIPEEKNKGTERDIDSDLPGDVLFTMINQFVLYGKGAMKSGEQRELKKSIGDWTGKYWNAFPEWARRLISGFLSGKINEKRFQASVKSRLNF